MAKKPFTTPGEAPGVDGPPLPEGITSLPSVNNPAADQFRRRGRFNLFRRKRGEAPPFVVNPEKVARNRTSELMMKFLATTAIRYAIRNGRPDRQDSRIKQAEHDYMNKLWDQYTRAGLEL